MFYHLTRSSPEALVPSLLAKALEAGWFVALRSPDEARLAVLDVALWREPVEGFLPHGLAGGRDDARQPILLSSGAGRPNGAQCLILLDGAGVEAEECAVLARICVIFDGRDEAALAGARGQWKLLRDAGLAAEYWSEESGRWQRKGG